jgi:hypothetical protein
VRPLRHLEDDTLHLSLESIRGNRAAEIKMLSECAKIEFGGTILNLLCDIPTPGEKFVAVSAPVRIILPTLMTGGFRFCPDQSEQGYQDSRCQ